ncbi:MAG: hypothetical protein DRQ01_06780 [Ignavibacteriae bacterium]|nr:MAG: hypothetical protein DRQ01_06780 [Ignavibacteriota bacterium]
MINWVAAGKPSDVNKLLKPAKFETDPGKTTTPPPLFKKSLILFTLEGKLLPSRNITLKLFNSNPGRWDNCFEVIAKF